MKRDQIAFVAALLLFGLFALAQSVQSSADDKKDTKAAVKDVKFACSHHGPTSMALTLSLENGTPQKIEFIGVNNGAKWTVKIDGTPAADGNGGKNGDTVKVHPGDTITWSITAANHGVAFAEKDLAQAMLEFDTTVGKPLEDLTAFLTTQPWKDFGTNRWGTKPIDAAKDPVVMVSCKVKK
jgi:plastocyanin